MSAPSHDIVGAPDTPSDIVDAPGLQWQPISDRLIGLKRIFVVLNWLLFTAVIAVPVAIWWHRWVAAAIAVLGVCWTAYRFSVQPRLVRSWGYAERSADLYIRHGLWFREMTVVPYGRMQVVTMNSGPIEQRFGLATVTLQTASSSTDATIPGLLIADAEKLRDRLSELGEQQAVGL